MSFFICFLYFIENLLGIESNLSSRIRIVLHLVEAILMYCQVSKSHSFTVYVSDMSTPTLMVKTTLTLLKFPFRSQLIHFINK